MLFAINKPMIHWALLAMDFDNNTIVVIDSLPGIFNLEEVKKRYFGLIDLMVTLKVKDSEGRVVKRSNRWTFESDRDAVTQEGGNACGVMTAMAGLAKFLGLPHTCIGGSSERTLYYRKFIAHTIVNGFFMSTIKF